MCPRMAEPLMSPGVPMWQDTVRGLEGAVSEGALQPAGHAPEDCNVLSLQLVPTLRLYQCLNRCVLGDCLDEHYLVECK